MNAVTRLLNYCATYPNGCLGYNASGMTLFIESDASYLSVPKACSRAAGFYYLSTPTDSPKAKPKLNGGIHVYCSILKEVCSSAAEAELAALFWNGKEACPIRLCLDELGHPQPPTPITTDNSTASGISNDTVKQKQSKAMDMRFYWIRDRVRQGQFEVIWAPGNTNLGDYFSKHHVASHHQVTRPTYMTEISREQLNLLTTSHVMLH